MTATGSDLWGDPPLTDDPLELAEWVCECLAPETPILALLRDVAAGELGVGVIHQLCRELGADGEPIDPWTLTEGLIIAGHDRLSHDLRLRLGLITRRGKRIRR